MDRKDLAEKLQSINFGFVYGISTRNVIILNKFKHIRRTTFGTNKMINPTETVLGAEETEVQEQEDGGKTTRASGLISAAVNRKHIVGDAREEDGVENLLDKNDLCSET